MFYMRRRFLTSLPLFAGFAAIAYLMAHHLFALTTLEVALKTVERGSRRAVLCGRLTPVKEVGIDTFGHAYLGALEDNGYKLVVYTRASLEGAGAGGEPVCVVGVLVSPFEKNGIEAEVALIESSRRTGWRAKLFSYISRR